MMEKDIFFAHREPYCRLEQPLPAKPIGLDIFHFLKREGRMVQPIERVKRGPHRQHVDELDRAAQELNVSRQAVIKTQLRQALDQYYLTLRARRTQPAS